VLGLAFFAVSIVVFIAIALVFMVCKIPFLGPILYVVAFPVAVLVAGLTLTALFLCMVLSLPAIWEGSSIGRALTQTFAIARSRLIEALLLLTVVGVLCFAVGVIAFSVIGFGLLPTAGMSASILGIGSMGAMSGIEGGGIGALAGMMQGLGGGYVIAGGIGFGVLWAIAMALVGQVYLQGLNLVYLRVTEGLDIGAAEAALQRGLNEARERSAELAAKAKNVGAGANRPVQGASSSDVTLPGAPAFPGMASPMTGAAAASTSSPFADLPGAAPVAVPPLATTPSIDPDKTAPLPKARPIVSAAEPLDLDFDLPSAAAQPPAAPVAPRAGPPLFPPAIAPAIAPVGTPASSPTVTSGPAPAAAKVTCPQCLSACLSDDLFCGVCGHRLK
jgi:hypothetical protein